MPLPEMIPEILVTFLLQVVTLSLLVKLSLGLVLYHFSLVSSPLVYSRDCMMVLFLVFIV